MSAGGGVEKLRLQERSSEGGGGDVAVAEAPPEVRKLRKYAVLLHNDDYTTMEFVIEVLSTFFGKSEDEAMAIMLQVHHQGRGVCGAYPFEIAETKVVQVSECARSRGYPLKCTMEEL